MTEEWRSIPGYEGQYQVSDQGRVRSLPRTEVCGKMQRLRHGRVLRQYADKSGYRYVKLSKAGAVRTLRISRLVLTAFVGDGTGREAAHKDHNCMNNALTNLEWVTRLENEQQKDAAKRRPPVPWQILTPERMQEVRALRSAGRTQKQIADRLS